MKNRQEVILAGSGGQGLVVAGILLAQAAILEGKNVVQTQSYGIAQRGGFSAAEIIVSEAEILYQQVEDADLIIVLSKTAVAKYEGRTGVVFYDNALIAAPMPPNWRKIAFSQIASDLGNAKTANLVALGALCAKQNIVQPDTLKQVIRQRFAPGVAESNALAIDQGFEAAASIQKEG